MKDIKAIAEEIIRTGLEIGHTSQNYDLEHSTEYFTILAIDNVEAIATAYLKLLKKSGTK